MTLKIYFDLMSHISRAVLLLCKVNKIPFTPKPIALRKLWPILQYLSDKYQVPDHWYPKDLRASSKVQEYMAWHHLNIRTHCGAVYRSEVPHPRATGSPPDEEKLAKHVNQMHTTLSAMEDVYLKDTPYLCGNQISIADLLGACIVLQVTSSGRDITDGHPKLAAWIASVKADLSPYFDEVFVYVNRVREMNLRKKAAAQPARL